MSGRNFKIRNLSTLVGSTWLNYFSVIRQGKISRSHYLRFLLITLFVSVSAPFTWWERLKDHFVLKKVRVNEPPVFILGHWRSGTTLLQNILCQDPDAAYVTTYQSVFPNHLHSKWLFKSFMRMLSPNKRPSDNVELNVDFPQEDEFAMSNTYPYSYYNFFFFPKNYRIFYNKALHFEGLNARQKSKWFKSYTHLLKKALWNTKGNRLVIKNPVNTARIKNLLTLYPDAKFIYIYRNPVTVFFSIRKFFRNLFPTLNLQQVDDRFIDELIFDVYDRLMRDYESQRDLIPEGHLVEIRYEDFIAGPEAHLKKI